MPNLLLLEDDPAIASTVVFALTREGFGVTHCTLVRDARRAWAAQGFDALILDVGLPDGNGLDWCRELRLASRVPVLMLSARGEELDRVLGLELGADDYVTKPFSPRELVARVRALLRRSAAAAGGVGDVVTGAAAPHPAPYPATHPATVVGVAAEQPFAIDPATQRISLWGQALDLTRREFGLLAKLLEGRGRIYPREALLDAVWGHDADSADRTVDTHIKTLRAKLRAVDAGREFIVTHRGMGYSVDVGLTPMPSANKASAMKLAHPMNPIR
jgi:two-component system, OmpR family, catabolic regulation response regulator CreB